MDNKDKFSKVCSYAKHEKWVAVHTTVNCTIDIRKKMLVNLPHLLTQFTHQYFRTLTVDNLIITIISSCLMKIGRPP